MDKLPQNIIDLNNKYFGFLGRNLSGDLNYKWSHTTFHQFHVPDGYKLGKLAESGLYAVSQQYQSMSWAERFGPTYILVRLQPALTRQQWIAKYGTSLPWAKGGEYCALENTELPVGKEPTEFLTQYTLFSLFEHLNIPHPKKLEDLRNQVIAQHAAQESEWSDVVDDAMPAFGNVPGQKNHVSFPASPVNTASRSN